MGRQYNYFISQREEIEFINYLTINSFQIIETRKEIRDKGEAVWNACAGKRLIGSYGDELWQKPR